MCCSLLIHGLRFFPSAEPAKVTWKVQVSSFAVNTYMNCIHRTLYSPPEAPKTSSIIANHLRKPCQLSPANEYSQAKPYLNSFAEWFTNSLI